MGSVFGHEIIQVLLANYNVIVTSEVGAHVLISEEDYDDALNTIKSILAKYKKVAGITTNIVNGEDKINGEDKKPLAGANIGQKSHLLRTSVQPNTFVIFHNSISASVIREKERNLQDIFNQTAYF